MNIRILISSLLLLPLIYCRDHNQDHNNTDWIKYLPSHVVPFVQSRLSTSSVDNDGSTLIIQESDSTDSSTIGETTNSSVSPEVMHDYGYNSSSNKSVSIGAPIGGIILFVLICYCCFRCCRGRETISQGVVIQPMRPPPQEPNIVIQHIHPQPNIPQPAQPAMVQHVYHQHAPPTQFQQAPQPQQFQQAPPSQQFQQAPPSQQFQQAPQSQQFQQQPPYSAEYETQQMLKQDWSPHAPMNQPQQQHYPQPDYPNNASAPPPSYGKY